jgi:hypothetical protein
MDAAGPAWCRDNVAEIAAHMQEIATQRGLPYNDRFAGWLIQLAIRLAEQNRPPNLREQAALAAARAALALRPPTPPATIPDPVDPLAANDETRSPPKK